MFFDKQTIVFKNRSMFGYYITLRMRSGLRLLKEIGVFRSLFLMVLLGLGILVLCKVPNRWMPLLFDLLVIGGYHLMRKDEAFLRSLTRNVKGFFLKEYLLLSLPFLGIAGIRGDGLVALYMLFAGCLMPFLRQVRMRTKPVRLRFFYAGNMEQIRMFRRTGWIYLILVGVSLLGCLHGNLRITKVAMLVWGIIHSGAYCLEPDPHILLKYKSFRMLQSLEWKSNAWNATVLSLPFGGMLFALGFRTEEVLFILSFEMAFILYLQGMTLFRWVCSADIGRVMIQVAIFIPLFVASCFIPYLNLVWLMLIGMFSYVVYVKWSAVWK